MGWTAEQVIAFAPDAASAKAGRELAAGASWSSLGRSDRAVWGLCKGSGASPYRVHADVQQPAFACTCPSRKLPCKHGLGLLLRFARDEATFATEDEPAWVGAWFDARAKKATRPRADAAPAPPPNPAAQTERRAERERKVAEGVAELDLWLRDLVRQGLATAASHPAAFWSRTAARMVDAQAPGLGRRVRALGSAAAAGDDAHARLLSGAAMTYTLVEAFGRRSALPPMLCDDLHAAVGFTVDQDELLGGVGVRDRWAVLAEEFEDDGQIKTLRVWLHGAGSGRAAQVVRFAVGREPLDRSLVPGTLVDAELVFFPGAFPVRALVKDRFGAPAPVETLKGFSRFEPLLSWYASALGRNPWLGPVAGVVEGLTPCRAGRGWALRDGGGAALPLAARDGQGWGLYAIGAGRPLTLALTWGGTHLVALGVVDRGHYSPAAAWKDS